MKSELGNVRVHIGHCRSRLELLGLSEALGMVAVSAGFGGSDGDVAEWSVRWDEEVEETGTVGGKGWNRKGLSFVFQ